MPSRGTVQAGPVALLAIVLYAVAVLAIGLRARRRAGASAEAFVVGDRSFGLLFTWAALSSTTIGGSTTLVLASLVATKGLPGFWLDLAGALGLGALGLFLAHRVRATRALTISEVIGRFYGPEVRRVAAFLVVLAEIVWFALLTQATETVVSAMTGWNADLVLVATAAVFVAYTGLGGQVAVVWTDLFQFALTAVGLVFVAAPLAARALHTGPSIPERLLAFPTGPGFGIVDVAAMLVLVGLPHLVGGDVWSKLLSAGDEKTARRAALLTAGTKLVVGAAVALVALAGVSAGLGPEPGRAAVHLPRTILHLVGPLAPLLLVALIATMQSSSDSVLLTAAASTTHDLVPSLGAGRPGPTRILVVVYGAMGLIVALALRDLVATFRLGYAVFAAGLILPTLAALAGLRVSPAFATAAMALGGGTALAASLAGSGVDPVLLGTGVNLAVLSTGAIAGRVAGTAAVGG